MSNQEPTVITLNTENAVQFLIQYTEVAQQKGAFMLNEAELLKRATDVLTNKANDPDINEKTAKTLLIQGIHKGQRHGSYTLQDAALLNKVVNYISNDLESGSGVPSVSGTSSVKQTNVPSKVPPTLPKREEKEDDLSDLAEPIPLRPNII